MRNIARYGLDSRTGKILLGIEGTGIRMGEHVSKYPGHSPVIMDYRHYRHGDPVRDIDWKISARTEKLFIKIREGYRQTDFLIAVDGSGSMRVSYNNAPSKFITALTIAYVAAKIALKSRDRVFLLWKGEMLRVSSEQSLIDVLLAIENDTTENDIWDISVHKGTNLFILSDFFVDEERLGRFIRSVTHVSKNIYSIIIQDPVEKEMKFSGRFKFVDPESDGFILSKTDDMEKQYHEHYGRHFAELTATFRSFGVRTGTVLTDRDPFRDFIRVIS